MLVWLLLWVLVVLFSVVGAWHVGVSLFHLFYPISLHIIIVQNKCSVIRQIICDFIHTEKHCLKESSFFKYNKWLGL